MFKFPFSTLHELNLDWILDKMKTLIHDNEEFNQKADYAVQTADEAKTIAEQAAQAQIADGAVTTIKLANNAVTTPKIANNAVTFAKLDADLRENLGAVILPTGDTTDRKAEIESKLSTYGYCEFREGDYYISAQIELSDGQTVRGIGKGSVLKKTTGGTNGFFFTKDSTKNVTIKDLAFKGINGSKPISDPGSGDFAISIRDHSGAVRIEGCLFEGLERCGIFHSSGYSVVNDSSLLISDCIFKYCGKGVEFTQNGEYSNVVNCTFQENYHGAWVQGGNNKFSNCGFDANAIGFKLYDASSGTNDGHGSCIGSSFNHNTAYAIECDHIDYGYVFSSNNIFYGDVHIINSSGILFSDCIMLGHKDSTDHSDIVCADCPGSVKFDFCMFLYTPLMNISNCPNFVRSNNETMSGGQLATTIRLLTTTYTSQSYVTNEDFNRIRFYSWNGLILCRFNLQISANPGSTFRTIGKANLPMNLSDTTNVVLAPQDYSADSLLVSFETDGTIKIYSTGTASGFYRMTFILF